MAMQSFEYAHTRKRHEKFELNAVKSRTWRWTAINWHVALFETFFEFYLFLFELCCCFAAVLLWNLRATDMPFLQRNVHFNRNVILKCFFLTFSFPSFFLRTTVIASNHYTLYYSLLHVSKLRYGNSFLFLEIVFSSSKLHRYVSLIRN